MMLLAKRLGVCLALMATAFAPAAVAAQQAEPTAWDGQHLSDQSANVQAAFREVWGDKAASQWSTEHSTALLKAASAAHGVPVSATRLFPRGPPSGADTVYAPLTFTTTHA